MEWWRGAVVYQIYPRSFMDSNGDGIGDLRGLIAKLDYVAALGVDAIWVSPFFRSPMKDFGYDVSDYRDVDPLFGTMKDCDRLIEKAHRLGLKVIFDLVLSHTSSEHPWFAESRQNRSNPKADWYVWADPKPDGSPPNNWQAFFGGPSWTYDVRRGQYYMHNFTTDQPDLNYHNPQVRKAALDVFKFWLDRGVDGFRLDVANCYMHDPQLRDNPASPDPALSFFNVQFPTPFTMQDHVHDFSRPENFSFIKDIREIVDRYEDRMTVAEIAFNPDAVGLAAAYTDGPGTFHTAYNFTLISGRKASASFIRDSVGDFCSRSGRSWPSWAFSNHDVVRVTSRWGGRHADDPRFAKVLTAVLCSLRGTAFIYQGEELGLTDAVIPFKRIQDPWGKFLYPHWQGRDGCRTPMPWESGARNAGFSAAARTWLPVQPEHKACSVNRQEKAADSPLRFVRSFLAWRKTRPELVAGDIEFMDAGDDAVLTFIRRDEGRALYCAFNLSERKKTAAAPEGADGPSLFVSGAQDGTVRKGKLSLPPFGMFYAELPG